MSARWVLQARRRVILVRVEAVIKEYDDPCVLVQSGREAVFDMGRDRPARVPVVAAKLVVTKTPSRDPKTEYGRTEGITNVHAETNKWL
jgi:hypothetical protein